MNITYPLLLDGGLSNELQKQGCCLNHNLWSAKLLESDPEVIVLAQLSYLESGARCIITSSYQANLPGFMALGHDASSASALILKSVHLAEEARNRFLASNPQSSKPNQETRRLSCIPMQEPSTTPKAKPGQGFRICPLAR